MTTISRLALLALLSASTASAQRFTTSSTEHNRDSARTILARSVVAHGARLLDSMVLHVDWTGIHTSVLQNVDPDFTNNPLPRSVSIATDARNTRGYFEERLARPGVYTGWHRYIATGTRGTDVNLNSQQFRSTSAPQVYRRIREMTPPVLVREALRDPAPILLRTDASQNTHVLHVVIGDVRYFLHVDASSLLLTRSEVFATLPLIGERAWQIDHGDYRSVGGVMLPRRRVVRLSGALAESLTVARAEVFATAPELFAIPHEAVPRDDRDQRRVAGTRIVALSPSVVSVSGLGGSDLTTLIIDLGDELLIAGAPGGTADSTILIARERFPGKPVRYVVPTHHHFDHSGALPQYIRAGVTVLTTPRNRDWFLEVTPDARIEAFSGKRVLGVASASLVELHDIGPTPHAREMTVVYLPSLRTLYQGDLLELDDDDPVTERTANEVTPSLLRAIERLGLDVDRIVGTEGRIATIDDLRRAVALRR